MLNRTKKILKVLAYSIIGLLILIVVTAHVFIPFQISNEEILGWTLPANAELEIKKVNVNDTYLRFVILKEKARVAPTGLLMIHGAPGSLSDYKKMALDASILKRGDIILVDRPGYGYSDYGNSIANIETQTAIIAKGLKELRYENYIPIGHSYGGPIALELGVQVPEMVKAISLMAPVNDPASEPMEWYMKLSWSPLVKWMLPKAIKVSADEKKIHARELDRLKERWTSINIPIQHIHGTNDFLAPAEGNINFSKKMLRSDMLDLVVLEGGDHFLIFTDAGIEASKKHLLPWLDKILAVKPK